MHNARTASSRPRVPGRFSRPAYGPRPAGMGSGWKIAYADFVTAMMALFLLLWITQVARPETRHEVAAYFRNADSSADAAASTGKPEEGEIPSAVERLERTLRTAAELAPFHSVMRFEARSDALILDVVDGIESPMFALGSDRLSENGSRLLARLAPLAQASGARLQIEGHTDAVPVTSPDRSNWALAAARAEAARRVLVTSGLSESRIEAVIGRADRVPLSGLDPVAAMHRRIRLVFQLEP